MHRAVGLSSAGRVHDASWDTESLFLTLQVFPSYPPPHCEVFPSYQPHASLYRCSLVIPPCLPLTLLQAVLDRPSVAPVHQGSSVGHALRRTITERRARGPPAIPPLVVPVSN